MARKHTYHWVREARAALKSGTSEWRPEGQWCIGCSTAGIKNLSPSSHLCKGRGGFLRERSRTALAVIAAGDRRIGGSFALMQEPWHAERTPGKWK